MRLVTGLVKDRMIGYSGKGWDEGARNRGSLLHGVDRDWEVGGKVIGGGK